MASPSTTDPRTHSPAELAPESADELSSDQLQAIGRALADPRRFAIFEQIARSCAGGGIFCSQLDVHDAISPATISHHLKELQDAGLVDARREGRSMHLAVRRSVWQAYLRRLQAL